MRYAYWSPRRDRRIRCACAHRFAPDALLVDGIATVRCRACSRTLVLVVLPGGTQRLVAEAMAAEVRALDGMAASAVAQFLGGVAA